MASRRGRLLVVGVMALAAGGVGTPAVGAIQVPDEARPHAESAESGEEPTFGGTLRMNIVFEGRSLDPIGFNSLGASSQDGFRAYALYDSLLQEDSVTGEVLPRLFETFESDDAVVWTFTIKEGVEFSDGTPFDAEAVKFNWERQADPDNAAIGLAAMSQVASVEVVDPLTLQVTLNQPNGQFPRVVAERLASIGSPTAIAADPVGFAEHPIGAGPFVLDQWIRDSSITFTRNETYWDAPRPYVDALELRINTDQPQRYQSFAAGEAEIVYISGLDVVTQAEDAGYTGVQFAPSGGRYVIFNTTAAPFDDVRARQAVSLAWDRQAYSDVIDVGRGIPLDSLFTEESPFHTDEPAVQFAPHDAEAAQALFDELAADSGGPLEFELLVSPATRAQGEFFQAALAEFDNVSMSLTEEQGATFAPRVYRHDYQAAIYATQLIDPEPELYDLFGSGSPRNLTGYTDDEFQAALQAGHESLDPTERATAYEIVARIMNEQAITYWFARWQQWTIYDADTIGGVSTFFDGVPYFEQVWMR